MSLNLTAAALDTGAAVLQMSERRNRHPSPAIAPAASSLYVPEKDDTRDSQSNAERSLQDETSEVKRDFKALQGGQEALRSRTAHLVAALQEANMKIAGQRYDFHQASVVKVDAQARLRQEFEERERELTAKYAQEKAEAAARLRAAEHRLTEHERQVFNLQQEADDRFHAAVRNLQTQHTSDLQAAREAATRPVCACTVRSERPAGPGASDVATSQGTQLRWTVHKEMQELKRRLKLESEAAPGTTCPQCKTHCSGACAARTTADLECQLRAKVTELTEKDRLWERRLRDREALLHEKHAEVVGHLRGAHAEQQILMEVKHKVREAELCDALAQAQAAAHPKLVDDSPVAREAQQRAEEAQRAAEQQLEDCRRDLQSRDAALVSERTARLRFEKQLDDRTRELRSMDATLQTERAARLRSESLKDAVAALREDGGWGSARKGQDPVQDLEECRKDLRSRDAALEAERSARFRLEQQLDDCRRELRSVDSALQSERAARLKAVPPKDSVEVLKETVGESNRKAGLLRDYQEETERLATRLRDCEARLAAATSPPSDDVRRLQRQWLQEKADLQEKLEHETAERRRLLQTKDRELEALRRETTHGEKTVVAQVAEWTATMRDLELAHAARLQEADRRADRRVRDVEDALREERERGQQGLARAAEQELRAATELTALRQRAEATRREKEESEAAARELQGTLDRALARVRDLEARAAESHRWADDVLATREVEFSERVRKLTEGYEAQLMQTRQELEERVSQCQTQYDAKCKELERTKRDLWESDTNFKELERQLREALSARGEGVDPRGGGGGGAVDGEGRVEALRSRVRNLEAELREQKDDAERAWKRAKEVDNQCKVLKERIREMSNDTTSQRMFPLLGLELTEGGVLRGDLRQQGVLVLSVRGPAQRAGFEADDVIQHVEIHHSAVVHDLYDFKQCADKIRPGDVVTATVLRRGIRLSKCMEVEASFSNPYKRHCYKKADPAPHPPWVSRLTTSSM